MAAIVTVTHQNDGSKGYNCCGITLDIALLVSFMAIHM